MFSVWTALLRVYEKNLLTTQRLRKKKFHAVNSLSKSLCVRTSARKSLPYRSILVKRPPSVWYLWIFAFWVAGYGRFDWFFLCWSCLRTPSQLKICWRADVHSAKHEQGETTAFAGFDRVEKRAIASNTRANYIIVVSTFCVNYVLSLSDINECTTNGHNCDANAFCNNTEGSFNCTCSPGYTGNGTSCNGYYQRYLAN